MAHSKQPKPPVAAPADNGFVAEPAPTRAARPCPNCGKMSIAESYPFCSKRCRMVDLNRWLTGAYAIPGTESQEDDGD